jgi:hypothetical protein
MSDRRDRQTPEEELVPADDTIIGVAVRRSLIALLLLAVVGGAAWLVARLGNRPSTVESAPTVAAPAAFEEVAVTPTIPFADVAKAAGITFVHVSGARGAKLLPESMGGGVAIVDVDGDGDQDLLFTNGAAWPGDPKPAAPLGPRLYRNDGDWRFVDISAQSGLATSDYGFGVAVGDLDADGLPDLYLTNLGPDRLYRNLGGGRFEDITASAGVGGDKESWSTGATFADFDRDGHLDLFVLDYVVWSPEIDRAIDYRLTGVGRAYGPPADYAGTQPRLYFGQGGGRFEDRSAEVAVNNPATNVPVGKGLGIAVVDLDRDGWVDLVVANDTVRNFVYHNQQGKLVEVGELWGLAYDRNGAATGAMGIDAAFHRDDQALGLAIGNFANEMSSLYVSQDDPTLFADEAIAEGIGAPSRNALSFGIFFADLDLDGRLDLLQANGHLETDIARVDPSQSYAQAAQLFWNAGPSARLGFALLEPAQVGDLGRPVVGRGSAFGDLDGDGDLDVVICQTGGAPLVLRNDQDLGHTSLRLRLLDPSSGNRDALGGVVEVKVGERTMRRVVTPTRSYLSQSELVLTFGLGQATAVDSITVIWPDGGRQEVDPATVPADGATHVVSRE